MRFDRKKMRIKFTLQGYNGMFQVRLEIYADGFCISPEPFKLLVCVSANCQNVNGFELNEDYCPCEAEKFELCLWWRRFCWNWFYCFGCWCCWFGSAVTARDNMDMCGIWDSFLSCLSTCRMNIRLSLVMNFFLFSVPEMWSDFVSDSHNRKIHNCG